MHYSAYNLKKGDEPLKRFPIFLCFAVLALVFCVALPVPIRLLPLPVKLTDFFGRFFPIPATALLTAFAYGALKLKKGGGLPAAALILSPLAYFGFTYALPYTTSFFNVFTVSAAALLAIIGEIGGRISVKQKKRKS